MLPSYSVSHLQLACDAEKHDMYLRARGHWEEVSIELISLIVRSLKLYLKQLNRI
jgi:hypothetical protein